ncbi:MAG: hypothetical protein GNW80_00760 [Asgard group archaeon]|nr:hypothetical protein [Asgard group archaeon]
MSLERERELIIGNLKEVEQKLVSFYKLVGNMTGSNKKATEIFAYLKIYDALTQVQIKQLTNFSSSTISTTLQSFLQTNIVSHELLRNSRKHIYKLLKDRAVFYYYSNEYIMDRYEILDKEIIDIQEGLHAFHQKYPYTTQFLTIRLNHIRNYYEAQRRAINDESKIAFLPEDVSSVQNPNNEVLIPAELKKFEDMLLHMFIRSSQTQKSAPIISYVIPYFITRRELDQETILQLTNLSRSTVSRLLQIISKNIYLNKSQREFRKPVKYCLVSFSLYILKGILTADQIIFSWIRTLNDLLNDLQTNKKYDQNSPDYNHLITKIQEILNDIKELKVSSNRLAKAFAELEFIVKK